jgi:hypothetical protein
MGFGSRQPTSNEVPATSRRWGPDGVYYDDTAALLNGAGARCQGLCGRVIMKRFLREHDGKNLCPDCHPEGPTKEMLRPPLTISYGASGEPGEAD